MMDGMQGMWGMGLVGWLVIIFIVVAIAALVERQPRCPGPSAKLAGSERRGGLIRR